MSSKPKEVYLDNNSTTSLSHEAADVMMDMIISDIHGNPNSQHEQGKKIRQIVDVCRKAVAESIGAEEKEVYFTAGGTESNNIALWNAANHKEGGMLIISGGEHSSVRRPSLELGGEDRVRIVPLKRDGQLDMQWAKRLITEDVSVVSVMLANNETGVVFPIKEIVDLAHSVGALVHCDAVQAYGKIPIGVKELGIDLLSISGHKAHSLPGVGALYVRKGVIVAPLFFGGAQENGLRPGTENYVGIASLGAVAETIAEGQLVDSQMRNAFEKGIKRRLKNVEFLGEKTKRVPNTSNILVKGVHSTVLARMLSDKKVYVSNGPACSSGLTKPSDTLLSMDLSEEEALSCVRISFSKYTSPGETAYAIEAFVQCINELRSMSIEETKNKGE